MASTGATVLADAATERISKKRKAAAAERALTQAALIENACAVAARETGHVVPGLSPDDVARLYAAELTRRPVPNRKERRAAARAARRAGVR